MKRLSTALTIVALLTALVIASIACGAAKEGQLPVLKVGNQWVYKMVFQGIEYNLTIEMTGEDVVHGKDCYVTDLSLEPAFIGIVDSITTKIDKATYFPVKTQMTGTVMSLPFSSVVTFSYEFPGVSYWPLEVGKEIEVIESTTMTTTAMGETETATATKTSTYKVERIEEITVAAGRFKCFKIVEYDEAGKKLSTSWHSDKVKQDVKHIDHESGETMELKSYSL